MERSFKPYIKTVDKVIGTSQKDFRYSKMFFSSSPKFILDNCDEKDDYHTLEILRALNNNGCLTDNTVIDVRVTMLMEGYYPAIPGWHCDDFPRYRNGQPDLTAPDSAIHYMCVIADTPGLSTTKFVIEEVKLELDEKRVWADLHNNIDFMVEHGYINTKQIKEGEIVQFNQEAIHTAVPATRAGWRLFFRASNSHRIPLNEIRKQVQVYTPLNAGW